MSRAAPSSWGSTRGPPGDAEPVTWYLGDDEHLTPDEPGRRSDGDADRFRFDPEAGGATLFGGTGDYPLLDPVWTDADWTRFGDGEELSYLTEPLTDDLVVAGPAVADLWVSSDVPDVDLQASISEVRPDGVEYLVTNGWLRVGHRAEDRRRTEGLEVVHPFTERAYQPLKGGEVVEARVDIPGFAHAFRAGSRCACRSPHPAGTTPPGSSSRPTTAVTSRPSTWPATGGMPSALVLSAIDGVRAPRRGAGPVPRPAGHGLPPLRRHRERAGGLSRGASGYGSGSVRPVR